MRRTLCARPTDGRQWNDSSYDSPAYGGVDFDSPADAVRAFAHLRQSKAVLNDERNLFSKDRRRRACPWQAFAVVFDDQRYFIGCVVPMHADMGRFALRMAPGIRQCLLGQTIQSQFDIWGHAADGRFELKKCSDAAALEIVLDQGAERGSQPFLIQKCGMQFEGRQFSSRRAEHKIYQLSRRPSDWRRSGSGRCCQSSTT